VKKTGEVLLTLEKLVNSTEIRKNCRRGEEEQEREEALVDELRRKNTVRVLHSSSLHLQ